MIMMLLMVVMVLILLTIKLAAAADGTTLIPQLSNIENIHVTNEMLLMLLQ